jgi:hypothetical protein
MKFRYWASSLMGVGVISAFTAGCASIITGTTQQMSFQSNPDGATVSVNGRVIGKTPISTSLKKVSGQSLAFSKDGYEPISMSLETHLNSWFWGNIVLGGLVGSTTDGVSGAVNEYAPTQYLVTLQPKGSTQLESASVLTDRQKAKNYIVLTYQQLTKELHSGGGEYLKSLFQMLNIPADKTSEATKKITALAEVYTNIPEFADRVVDIYLK